MGCVAQQGNKSRVQGLGKITGEGSRAKNAEPDDGQEYKEDGSHEATSKHGARNVANGVDRFANVTGGGFKGWCGKAHQIETCHGTSESTEEAREGGNQLKTGGLLPVNMTCQDGDKS